jgi:hypothetical protein
MKKIKFLKTSPLAEIADNHPSPAINNLPDFFKKMPAFAGEKHMNDVNMLNQTIKRCVPVLDALSAGYVIKTPVDMWVELQEDVPFIRWSVEHTILSVHDKKQVPEEMIPDYCYDIPFKMMNDFGIKTPPGYSTLFLPILNVPNNPIVALSGIVETDNFNIPVNFPFFLKRGFSGKIPAGTPVAQLIPFQRENWKSEIDTLDEKELLAVKLMINRSLEFAYKKIFWKRKQYN